MFQNVFLGIASLRRSLLMNVGFGFLIIPSQAMKSAKIDQDAIAPFLIQYCFECHGEDKQKGDLRFDTLSWEITDNPSAQDWQDILDVLNTGEMPPKKAEQPEGDELKDVIKVLTDNLTEAREILVSTGGVNPIRRLNKREYLNSVKHLFGINVHESYIPDDLRGEHFDTNGYDQYIDGPLIEQYLRIGTKIAQEGMRWSARPYTKPKITSRREGGDFYGRRGKRDFGLPKSDEGFYLYKADRGARSVGAELGDDPRGSYKVRVEAAVNDKEHPRRHFLDYSKVSAIRGQKPPVLGVVHVTGSLEKPSVSEFLIPRETLSLVTKPQFSLGEVTPRGILNAGRWFPVYLNGIGAKRNNPNVWVKSIEVEGPFYDSKTSVLGGLLNVQGENLGGTQNARKLLERFTYEAFRRNEPSPQYVNRLANYFGLRLKAGLSYGDAMSETLGLVLASPSFLYLEQPKKENSRLLNARAFAARLSYFLWSAPPDEELYAMADSQVLFEPIELRKQVVRMLNDPKAESFYEGFMGQWAEIDRFLDISIDWKNNLKFNSGVQRSAAREPVEFFKTLVRENLSIDYLIDSPFVVVDPILADFYDLPGERTFQGFQKTPLPPGSHRGGFITQSAFLTLGSNGIRSSPVIRGALVLEKLLNNPPAQPPPNVPEIEAASDRPLSNRELVELHRNQAACASCHDQIDPIGFGLENFDTIGLWRDSERVGGKDVAIKAEGVLAHGIQFNGLEELQELLKSAGDKLTEGLVESLTSYAIGRPLEFTDQANVKMIVKNAKDRKLAMQDVIVLVVNSDLFRIR